LTSKARSYSTKVPENVQQAEKERLEHLTIQFASIDEVLNGLARMVKPVE
jgi:hypothetical protein